jgi:hypothetical protein
MAGWKRLVLVAAGFGGGFAVITALILGAWGWGRNHLHKEPDWNTTAIKATLKSVTLDPSDRHLRFEFSYQLQNATDADYSFEENSPVIVMTKLVLNTTTGETTLQPDSRVTLPSSFYIPAKQDVMLTVFDEAQYDDTFTERDMKNSEKSRLFFARKLKDMQGFVIFDRARRYKIILPNW